MLGFDFMSPGRIRRMESFVMSFKFSLLSSYSLGRDCEVVVSTKEYVLVS